MKVHRAKDGALFVFIVELPLSDRKPFQKWLGENVEQPPVIDGETQPETALWEDYQRWKEGHKKTVLTARERAHDD
jgi:hypothetical protein